jgi:hypothetical protein
MAGLRVIGFLIADHHRLAAASQADAGNLNPFYRVIELTKTRPLGMLGNNVKTGRWRN